MKRVVMFSGGVASWCAAKRMAAEHGRAELTLLFTDTLMEEDPLWYEGVEWERCDDCGGKGGWLECPALPHAEKVGK